MHFERGQLGPQAEELAGLEFALGQLADLLAVDEEGGDAVAKLGAVVVRAGVERPGCGHQLLMDHARLAAHLLTHRGNVRAARADAGIPAHAEVEPAGAARPRDQAETGIALSGDLRLELDDHVLPGIDLCRRFDPGVAA